MFHMKSCVTEESTMASEDQFYLAIFSELLTDAKTEENKCG